MTGLDTNILVRFLVGDDRRHEIADVLEKLLSARQFLIEQKDVSRLALRDYDQGKADFADYLIGRINKSAGCKLTLTFDKSLEDASCFKLLDL